MAKVYVGQFGMFSMVIVSGKNMNISVKPAIVRNKALLLSGVSAKNYMNSWTCTHYPTVCDSRNIGNVIVIDA